MDARGNMREPLLLLVSGAPGSGKTTLAEILSQKMGLYHVERDKLKFGIEFGLEAGPLERKNTVVPVYFKVISSLLDFKVSCIADGAHFRGKSENNLEGFKNKAIVLNIHCYSANPIDRARKRDEERNKTQPDWAEEYVPDYDNILAETSRPVNHGYKVLEVDCTNEYDPGVETIVNWVYEQIRS